MNYKKINSAILGGTNYEDPLDKNVSMYLLNNKVALYYVNSKLGSESTWTNEIKKQSTTFEKIYIKTLHFVVKKCYQNNIDFILYKTHKFVNDLNDGDIDIMVKPEDFEKFLQVFRTDGFSAVEDEPGKGKCEKNGYSVIEPHTNVSWRGGGYLDQEFIWKNTQTVNVAGVLVKNVSYEVEYVAILAKLLFEPAYLDLYSAKALQYFDSCGANHEAIINHSTRPELIKEVLEFCNKALIEKDDSKYPIFLPNWLYLKLWTKNFLHSKNFKIYFLHIIYFFYWKYRYLIFDKLPFTHHHAW